jgi:hypothetical protein
MYFDVWELAQSLSQAIRETVVSFYANDPILRLDLYERGARVDKFSNYPEKFGAQTGEEKQSFGGKPMKWQPLLIPGAKAVDLERALTERTIEVTQNTGQVGKLLGMNPERIWHVQPTSSAMDDRSFTVLKFRETDEWYESYERERLT